MNKTNDGNERHFHFGYLVVITLILTSFLPLSLGLSCAGLFFPAISEDLSVGKGTLGYYMSVLWFATIVFLPFLGRLFNGQDARLCVGGGVLIVVIAFVWLSFTRTLWHFLMGAFLMGIGVAILLFLAPSTLINRWFFKRAGFLLGIVMCFTGIGGVVWSYAGGLLIQAIGWSATYLVFAVMSALTLPAAVLMVRSKPDDIGVKPWGWTAEAEEAAAEAASNMTGISASKAFRMPVFFLLLINTLLLNFGMYVNAMIPSYISTLEISVAIPLLGATASSVAMAGQTVAKLVLGYVGEKRPYISTAVGVGLGVVGLVLFVSGLHQVAFIYAAAFFYGFFYGITNVMNPILTKRSFGNLEYPKIYSRIAMASSIGSMTSGFIWGALIDATGSFNAMFYGVIVMMILAIVCLGIISRLASKTAY